MYTEISRFISVHCPKLRRLRWDNNDNYAYWASIFKGDIDGLKDYLLSAEALYS